MARFWSPGLQTKLLALSIAVVCPVVVLAYFQVQENVDYTSRQIVNSSVATSRIVESNAAIFIEGTERLLRTLAQTSAVRARSALGSSGTDLAAAERETHFLLIDTLPLHPGLLNLVAADRSGAVYAEIIWPGGEPRTIAHQADFQRVLATGRPSFSQRFVSRASHEPAVSLTVPVLDDQGQPIGAIGADLSLHRLQEALETSEARQYATVLITDSDGTVLVHSNYKYVSEETSLAELAPVRAALAGQQGTLTYDRHPGDPWFAAYLPLPNTGWAVVVTSRDLTAQPPVRDAFLRGLASIGITLMFAIAISALLARRITHPLHQLTRAARAIAHGDLRQQVRLRSRDELQDLANAFNLMSHSLATNVTELVKTRSEVSEKAQELERLLGRLVRTQEEERSRIAKDVHDGPTQLVIAALYEAQAASACLAADRQQAGAKLDRASQLLNDAVVEMRRVIFNLRPPVLDDIGLVAALRRDTHALEETTGLPCHFQVEGQPIRLPQPAEIALYRVVQEALSNIRRHAQASHVELTVTWQPQLVRIVVADDGQGFELSQETADASANLGLISMRERARSIGGQLALESGPGQGTRVTLTVPLRPPRTRRDPTQRPRSETGALPGQESEPARQPAEAGGLAGPPTRRGA